MTVCYHERQGAGPWWVWPIVGVAALAAWVGGVALLAAGGTGDVLVGVLVIVVVGVLLPLVILTMHLDVTVDDEAVRIRFFPFTRRAIPLAEIAHVEARRYRPLREYGGWGIKGWSRRKIAYNVAGDEGADLTLVDGRRVLLGSRRAADLADAIVGAQSDAGGSPFQETTSSTGRRGEGAKSPPVV